MEACKSVLQGLQAINREFKDIDREDKAAAELGGRLCTIHPAISRWVQGKSQIAASCDVQVTGECPERGHRARVIKFRDDWFKYNGSRRWDLRFYGGQRNATLAEEHLSSVLSAGDARLVQKLQGHVSNIHSWLYTFRQKGKAQGILARGMHVCKNLKKRVMGEETTFEQLLSFVAELEKTLHDMQVVMQVELTIEIAKVVSQQEVMMQKVSQLLARSNEGMSAAEKKELAEETAEICRMHVDKVLQELRSDNAELWGQVDRRLDRIESNQRNNHAELRDAFQEMGENIDRQLEQIREALKSEKKQGKACTTVGRSPEVSPRGVHAPLLPYGWEPVTSNSGKTYYKNRHTGQTQSEFPEWVLIKNREARTFWQKYFGNEDTVSWNLCKKAMQKEFQFGEDDLTLMQEEVDCNGDGVVSQLEFNIFSIATGIRGALERLREKAACPDRRQQPPDYTFVSRPEPPTGAGAAGLVRQDSIDPRTGATVEAILPQGWEKRTTAEGKDYYVNHTHRSTQWEAPKALNRCGACGRLRAPRNFSKNELAKVDGLCKDCKRAAVSPAPPPPPPNTHPPASSNAFCVYCGAKHRSDSNFCSKCGKPRGSQSMVAVRNQNCEFTIDAQPRPHSTGYPAAAKTRKAQVNLRQSVELPLVFSSGLGLCTKTASPQWFPGLNGGWTYYILVATTSQASFLSLQWVPKLGMVDGGFKGNFVYPSDSVSSRCGGDRFLLNVVWDKYECGNEVNLVSESDFKSLAETARRNGRSWVINHDGSVAVCVRFRACVNFLHKCTQMRVRTGAYARARARSRTHSLFLTHTGVTVACEVAVSGRPWKGRTSQTRQPRRSLRLSLRPFTPVERDPVR